MEFDEIGYRTHSGIYEGKIVTSGWKYPKSMNVGKSNETSVSDQVKFEVESRYKKQCEQGGYKTSIDLAKNDIFSFNCMLASKYDNKKHVNFPYMSQPKLDGVRCIATRNGLFSRNGKSLVSSPHIYNQLKNFFEQYPDVILDGELYNHNLKENFEKIISLVRRTKPTKEDLDESFQLVEYHVYDMYDNNDMAFSNRREFLNNTFNNRYHSIKMVYTNVVNNIEELMNTLNRYLIEGYEGQILRVPDSKYEGKRSKFLIKHKEFEDQECIITDVIEGVGNWAGYAKAIEVRMKNGVIQQAGMRGNQELAKNILQNSKYFIGTECTVRYQNLTSDGKMRFPIVTVFWKGNRDI